MFIDGLVVMQEGIMTPVDKSQNDIGLFDVAYDILDCDVEWMQLLINWLATNCTHNFIVMEQMSRVAAGGWVDNRRAFENGCFRLNEQDRKDKDGTWIREWQVRLSNFDDVLFSLVWMTK